MTGRTTTERILDAYLAPQADRIPDRVIVAALDEVAKTPQRRALRAPWRFPTMPAISRATGIAAVALVAVVGAAGVMYLASNSPGDTGSRSTPALTPAPTTALTPEPSFVSEGITGWKTYTSAVYDYTISYPEDWHVGARATQKWQPGEAEEAPSSDVFADAGDEIAFFALQFPAPTGADLGSWDGLLAALTKMCAKPAEFYDAACPSEGVTRMCLGSPGCHPVAFVHQNNDQPRALFGDPETGLVTYIHVGRSDDFPAAARYGGSVMLLKSLLSQLDVREPQPGETPKPPAAAETDVVKGWPGNAGSNPPGLYSWDGLTCETTNCLMGVIHNHVADSETTDQVRVSISQITEWSISGASAMPVTVAGHEGLYLRIDPQLEEWNVDFDGTLMSITLSVERGADEAAVDEAYAIIESLVYEQRDTPLGFRLVFRLPSSQWDSPF